MKVARTVWCNINTASRDDVQNIQVPAPIDNGADTFPFAPDFHIFEWTDRNANVISFDKSLQLENLRIGSGVTACKSSWFWNSALNGTRRYCKYNAT